ncbi:MAG: SUMF1/EgtB/PvdO family nonheme iron enzyme [Planctomycetes bacterium]|nr:SUMF1/EgtB/PvdO family nonheme iron enzyme [Planctomycetota bacterium]
MGTPDDTSRGSGEGDGPRVPHRVWGDFELHELLGRGGMGAVYRGRQISLNRPVAIKVLGKDLADKARFRKRFLREARAVAQVNSPHVVQIHFAGVHEAHHYYVMELVEGVDLARKMASGLRLTLPAAFDLMLQATRGLVAASRLGIVHRDIKPSNMLITGDGVLKLSDFGIAKLVNEERVTGETETGLLGSAAILGTPTYLSPELATGAPCDHRADIYSLGIVFYELLTGVLPFTGSNAAAIAYQHAHQAPRAPRTIEPTLHPDLNALVMRCLAKKPSDRFDTAQDLLTALEDLLLDHRITANPTALRIPAWTKPAAIAAAALFAAAGLAWVGASLIDQRPRSTPSAGATEIATDSPLTLERAMPVAAATPRAPAPKPISPSDPSDLTLTVGGFASGYARPEPEPAAIVVDAPPLAPASDPTSEQPRSVPAAAPPIVASQAKPVEDGGHTEAALAPQPVLAPPTDDVAMVPPATAPIPVSASHREVGDPSRQPLVLTRSDPLDAPASTLVIDNGHDETSLAAAPAPGDSAAEDSFGRYQDVTIFGVVQRFRWCPPGTFLMGSPDDESGRGRDEDIHQVTLTRGFWLADSECTQALWVRILESSPSMIQDEHHPVERVSWETCQEFIARLNEVVPGLRARLPSESEWEYACRAGGADDGSLDGTTWHARNTGKGTQPVKQLQPNPWGFYDIHGNVAEWCEDRYAPYPKPLAVDPIDLSPGAHVLRGGSYRESPKGCRSAHRDHGRPRYLSGCVGLRLAASELPR